MERIPTKRLLAALPGILPPMWCQGAEELKVASPDGVCAMTLSWQEGKGLTYRVQGLGAELVGASEMGYRLASGEIVPGPGWVLAQTARRAVRGVWRPLWGKRAEVPDAFDEVTLGFRREAAVDTTGPDALTVTARAYDDGVAFSYAVPAEAKGEAEGAREATTFAFAGDCTAWYTNGERHNLGPERLSEAEGRRPVTMTLRADRTHWMALHEADLRMGEPLALTAERGSGRFSVASRPAPLRAGFASAWRVLFVGATPGAAVDSHLLELLNPPPEEGEDFSWVRPGVAVWDWRINGAVAEGFRYGMDYPSWVRMVDFAAEQGFRALVLDANWYGPEFGKASDPTKGGKADDVRRIIAYGKGKGVGVWLYLNDVGGRHYPLEETLARYGAWGAAGVKYGFMKGSPEEKNLRTRRITELCARHRLAVDFHDGPVHPYGQMRTWPNALTREYCHAQLDAHRVFRPKTFVTSVFVNMVAGPLDMNNGMFDLRQGPTTRVDESQPVPSTVVAEAARTLIVFSGATILPDIPEYYRKFPELLDFIASERQPWVESRTLSGEVGEFVVMMRQTKEAYLVAAATNEERRIVDIPLGFLPEGDFVATVAEDGDDAHYLTNKTAYKTFTRTVSRKDTLTVTLAPGGGACGKLTGR